METLFKGIDCATPITKSVAAQLMSEGYKFAGRYLVPSGTKRLTKSEAQILTDAGLLILTVYETSANRAQSGSSNGIIDGIRAYAYAKEIEMPESGCIYFAVDYGAASSDYENIAAYLKSAKAQIGNYKLGVYGSYYIVEEMCRRVLCDCYWQCVAWSNGKVSERINAYQHSWGKTAAGISVDLNDCYDATGLWNYNTEEEMRYNTIDEIPEYGKATIQKLINAGALNGTGAGLNITDDMLRVFVINDRMGLYK